MDYGYYPGCSLKGTGRKLEKGLLKIFEKMGHRLLEIPDWNCCGAFEYGDRRELSVLNEKNLERADVDLYNDIMAPCPACHKNLKEAATGGKFNIRHPLDLFNGDTLSKIDAKRDLKGLVITPYYGCLLLRPEETAIINKRAMEETIEYFGGKTTGEKIRDKCCGGSQFFINREVTEKLSTSIAGKSEGVIAVFCPLCHMALSIFSKDKKVLYLTDIVLYVMGESKSL